MKGEGGVGSNGRGGVMKGESDRGEREEGGGVRRGVVVR